MCIHLTFITVEPDFDTINESNLDIDECSVGNGRGDSIRDCGIIR